MSQREIMKHLATQEAAQWDEEEEQANHESKMDSREQLAEIGQRMEELNARQARIENHLVKMIPSARKAEEQFGMIVLAGKELHEGMEQQKKGITTIFSQYSAQVKETAGKVKEEFQYQREILQIFFDKTMEISDRNEQIVGQCQEMVAMSSAIYNKGSAGVQETSEKTQAHLKSAADAHRKEIEAQAQHFKTVYKRLTKLVIIGTIVIFICALMMGTMAGLTWLQMKQQQKEESSR
jgi:hypothetical protein